MLNRRAMLGAAGACLAGPAWAQDDGYGAPGPTRPFGPEVFRARRERLMSQIRGGVAVVYSGDSLEAPQNPHFAYLTGIYDEAGAALVLAPEERTHKQFLFLANRDPEIERYEGERLALSDTILARTGFDRARRMSRLGAAVTQLATHAPVLHFLGPLADPTAPVPAALQLYREIAEHTPGIEIRNSARLIEAMRAAHEPREIEAMRNAVRATERGLRAAMGAVRPGMREFEVKYVLENEFRAAGARGLAFPSIVATGRTSAVLHYPHDDGVVRGGDMMLCDVGAEYDHYAADITRTFPVDGRFSDEQREIYSLVLSAQEAAMRKLRAGAYYEDLQKEAESVFQAANKNDAFWHGLGHFVGLEVHDAGDYSKPLPAGAVVTIEPGLYLPARGFGVRIEDMFLVTRGGCEHITSGVPREPEALEALIAELRA